MLGGAEVIRVHETVAGYRVREHLGRGGMSDVYLVDKLVDGVPQRFAMKCILPRWAHDPEHRALFQREARIASTFHHPNIVEVVDFGAVGDTPYLVLEYVYGLDLRKLGAGLAVHAHEHGPRYPGQEIGALPPAFVVWIGIAVARALHAVHSARSEDGRLLGYVHRDVALANILVDYFGRPRLADFGVAKAIHAATGEISTTAAARGRAQYMAPEQILGDCDRRSDIFSLGVVLFELCAGAGRQPYEDPAHPNQERIGLMTRALRGERAFTIAEALPGLPPRLHALLEQLVHPDPHKRPAAGAIADELTAILPELGTDLAGAEKLARWTLRLVYTEGPPSHVQARAPRAEEPSSSSSSAVEPGAPTTGIQPSASPRVTNTEPAMDRHRRVTGPLEGTTPDPDGPTTGVQPAGTHGSAEPVTALEGDPITSASPTPVAFAPGMRIGPFTIVREIASGGMGSTYVAKREDVDKRVCLKTILPAHAADPQYRELFLSEAKTAAKASHPHVVSLVDFGEHESGALWLAYEIVDGTDVGALLKRSPHRALRPEHVACVAVDIAHALNHLHTPDHRRGVIIHRDISPNNIMVSYDGNATLIDLGIAKMSRADNTQTDIKGKLGYMAPEVLRGDAIGPAIDQWALGVTLYRMLTGRLPYKNAYDGSAPPPPESPHSALDPRWLSILSRLLHPDPTQRYPSLAAMLDELAPLIPGPGVRLALGKLLRRQAPPKSVAPGPEAVDEVRRAVLEEKEARVAHDAGPTPEPLHSHAARREIGAMQPGERFGEWVIEKKLGTGGMAVVYKATRTRTIGGIQTAALKLIRPEHAASEDFVARFESEVAIAMRLNHQNVVHVLDAGEVDGVYFMAMEYVEGCDVDSLVRALTTRGVLSERRLPPEIVTFIAAGLLQGLEYAHGHGVVHRDVSPHNIMVTVAGEVKLNDFGVAKSMSADGMASKTSHAIGKPHYMPPEQFRGDPLDGRADLFAAGVSIFEMLGGVTPYAVRGTPNETIHLIVQRIFANDRPHVADVAPHAPAELIAEVERLLQPNRDLRPASAEAVLTTLEPLVQLRCKRHLAELVRAAKDDHAGPISQSVLDAVRVSAPPLAQARAGGTVPLGAIATPSSNPSLASSPGPTPSSPAVAPVAGAVSAPSRLPWLVLAVGALGLIALGLVAFAAVFFWPDEPARPVPTASHEETPPPAPELRRDTPTVADDHSAEVPAGPVQTSQPNAPTPGAETTAPESPSEPARAEVAAPDVEPAASPQDGHAAPPRRSPRPTHETRPVARPIAPTPLSGPSSAPPAGRTRGGTGGVF